MDKHCVDFLRTFRSITVPILFKQQILYNIDIVNFSISESEEPNHDDECLGGTGNTTCFKIVWLENILLLWLYLIVAYTNSQSKLDWRQTKKIVLLALVSKKCAKSLKLLM